MRVSLGLGLAALMSLASGVAEAQGSRSVTFDFLRPARRRVLSIAT